MDAFRYFMLHEVTIGQDGAFSEDLLAERYTTDLANDLGNLWFRIATMLDKYFQGKAPANNGAYLKEPLVQSSFELLSKVTEAMDANDPRLALDHIFSIFKRANQFVEEKKPWTLAKDPAKKEELSNVILVLLESVAHAAVMLQAFIPETAAKILGCLGLENKSNFSDFSKSFLSSDKVIAKGAALFPRLDEEAPAK